MTFAGSQQGQASSDADHTFKGSHNFAFQGHCFGEIAQSQKKSLRNSNLANEYNSYTGLYDSVLQIKKKQNSIL